MTWSQLSRVCRHRIEMPRGARSPRINALLALVILFFLLALEGPFAGVAHADANPSFVPNSVTGMQSCNDAYDQTGLGGAGIGQIRATENGVYSFSVKFNPEFIASLPPTTDFVWGEARVSVNGKYAFAFGTSHERPISDQFHAHIKLQGFAYGKGNRSRIQRGDYLAFDIALLLIDPVSRTFYPGHGRILCRL